MNQIELLSPVGNFECLKAAVQAGCDCVYFGGELFNARASAGNFNDDELKKAIEYAKIRNVKTNLALNILIKNDEFEDAFALAKKAYEYGIDAIIVQDLGLAKKLIETFPDLPIHASTQMTIHNLEGVLEAEKVGFKRVVLSRELSLNEIKYICEHSNIEIEVFIHGALCICYSGQCLFSSMIGARSGNRGKCAQPCRLPYELLSCNSNNTNLENEDSCFNSKNSNNSEKNTCKIIDKGYLLSTKDLCSLELLPELVNSGVTSFKIEGRLKTPEYVSTVTRIYRKYIDLAKSNKPYIVEEKDKQDLLQVFNRGGFSNGYLENEPNTNLIYKNKPNNMGIYLGTVHNFNPNKGYVTLKLENSVSIGDSVSVEKEKSLYNVSELLIQNNNIQTANKGDIVKIGRIKGKINVGDKIYKISSKELSTLSNNLSNSETVKAKINCKLTVHENEPVKINIYSTLPLSNKNNEIYNNINFEITANELIPVIATNTPITAERIKEQINKLGNTPFEFENIEVDLGENLYLPSISKLNQLRRDAIEKLNSILLDNINRKLNETSTTASMLASSENNNAEIKQVSILLNTLNLNNDYTKLNNINRIYIPLKFFYESISNTEYANIIKSITANYNTYIYMPSILKNTAELNNISNIKHIINTSVNTYKIKGFAISNISHLDILSEYLNNYEITANYNMNIYNNNTIQELKKLGINLATISPELDKLTINSINHLLPVEAIVYGSIPVMTINYCLISKSNNCLQYCNNNCIASNNKYYLNDRMDLKFRVIPDSFTKTTTIYNSKKISYSPAELNVDSIRFDFIDETIEEMNSIIEQMLSGNVLEGKEYTNGNYNRFV